MMSERNMYSPLVRLCFVRTSLALHLQKAKDALVVHVLSIQYGGEGLYDIIGIIKPWATSPPVSIEGPNLFWRQPTLEFVCEFPKEWHTKIVGGTCSKQQSG